MAIVLARFVCALQKANTMIDDQFILAEETAVAHVAIVLSAILQQSGWSQKRLAKEIKVSEKCISQILMADKDLTVKTLARIGHVLGYRLRVVFDKRRK